MKIRTTISIDVERADGTKASVERTTIAHDGDNPRFERRAVGEAVSAAFDQMIQTHSLDTNEKPL